MDRISPNIKMGYMHKKHPIGREVIPGHKIEYSKKKLLEGKDLA